MIMGPCQFNPRIIVRFCFRGDKFEITVFARKEILSLPLKIFFLPVIIICIPDLYIGSRQWITRFAVKYEIIFPLIDIRDLGYVKKLHSHGIIFWGKITFKA